MSAAPATYPTPPSPPPSRPLGVAILAVLVGLLGLIFVIGGIVLLVAGTYYSTLNGGGIPQLLPHTALIAGAIVLIIGLIILGLAVGLWHQRMWALVLTLIVLIVELVSYGLRGDFVTVGFGLSAVLFVYLLAVHRHFR